MDGARCCRRRSTTVSPKCAREPPLRSGGCTPRHAPHMPRCRPRVLHCAASSSALLRRGSCGTIPHTTLPVWQTTCHHARCTTHAFALLCFDSHPRPRAKEGAAAGIAARVPTPTSTCALASLRSLFIVLLTARRHISAARARNEPASLIRCVPPKWR